MMPIDRTHSPDYLVSIESVQRKPWTRQRAGELLGVGSLESLFWSVRKNLATTKTKTHPAVKSWWHSTSVDSVFFTLKILLQPLMYPGTVENTNFRVTMGQFDLSAQTLPWEANLVSTDVSFWSGQGVHTWAKLLGGFFKVKSSNSTSKSDWL